MAGARVGLVRTLSDQARHEAKLARDATRVADAEVKAFTKELAEVESDIARYQR